MSTVKINGLRPAVDKRVCPCLYGSQEGESNECFRSRILWYSLYMSVSFYIATRNSGTIFGHQSVINQILFFIAALGATMDVGMSIASTIQELHERSPQLGTKELFVSGIRVGRDMMGTMANTLIFAYVGGSLSTLVVNYAYNLSYNQLINSYVIGTEIMQGLSGTLGVVLTVPITAAVAAVLIGKKKIVKEPLMQDIYDGSDDYEEPETDGEYGEDV